ncbi:sensor domain-containing diguanylate cyclase [Aquabacterium olei]|uniref:diguanylate cyclase n=1 Tax=Aquabacterium olei TaxID=1296669 RepID=A0A2U8FMP7_9BURK|nr:sensor domain-containing diguanylate cyclase [Aquabacterium olei]
MARCAAVWPALFDIRLPSTLVQSVLDALPTPVFFKDRAGRYRGCNRAFTELMGKRPDELLGMSVFDLSPPELARVYQEADEALMLAGGEQRYEAEVQRPNGERLHVLFYKAAVRDEHGVVCGLVGTILDITERKALEHRLADLADRDALTGLLNRRAILAHLEGLHADRRQARQPLCLLMVDVDHFKSINDRFGHAIGDEALVRVAGCLRSNLRDGDRVGRIGGEEFLVVLGSTDLDDARGVAERLRQAVSQIMVETLGGMLQLTVSVGLASSLPDEDWAHVLGRADEGLYAAKRTGRDRVVVAQNEGRHLLSKDWRRS